LTKVLLHTTMEMHRDQIMHEMTSKQCNSPGYKSLIHIH